MWTSVGGIDYAIGVHGASHGWDWVGHRGALFTNETFQQIIAWIDANGSAPDLQAKNLNVSNTVWRDGDEISIDFDVMNSGDTPTSKFTEAGLFISSSPDVSTGDTLIASGYMSGPLAPGAVETPFAIHDFVFSQGSLEPGTYWVAAIADFDNQVIESNIANNISDPIQITILDDDTSVPPPAPVLSPVMTVHDVSVSAGFIQAGSNISLGYTISNIGNIFSSGSVVGVYLSTTPDISTSDELLASFNHFTIAAGGSHTATNQSVRLPDDLPPGEYWIGMVAGYDNDLAGTATDGSASSGLSITVEETPPPPEYDAETFVQYFVLDRSSAEVGETVYMEFGIDNMGTVDTGDFHIEFYFTSSRQFDDPVFSGEHRIASLPRETRWDFSDWSIWANGYWETGDYYVAMVVDSRNEVVADSSSWNIHYAPLRIIGEEPNTPATISGLATGLVVEDDPERQVTSGTLTVVDPDPGENRFAEIPEAALYGDYGTFSFDPLSGAWVYTLDNELDAVQALPEGAEVTDSLTVTSLDGTASETITVTVRGVNDPATITGNVLATLDLVLTNDGFDPGLQQASGVLAVTDPDAGEDRFREPEPSALQGVYGSFAFDPDTGAWTYIVDKDAETVRALPVGAEVTDTLTVTSLDGTASESITVNVTVRAEPVIPPVPPPPEIGRDLLPVPTEVAPGTRVSVFDLFTVGGGSLDSYDAYWVVLDTRGAADGRLVDRRGNSVGDDQSNGQLSADVFSEAGINRWGAKGSEDPDWWDFFGGAWPQNPGDLYIEAGNSYSDITIIPLRLPDSPSQQAEMFLEQRLRTFIDIETPPVQAPTLSLATAAFDGEAERLTVDVAATDPEGRGLLLELQLMEAPSGIILGGESLAVEDTVLLSVEALRNGVALQGVVRGDALAFRLRADDGQSTSDWVEFSVQIDIPNRPATITGAIGGFVVEDSGDGQATQGRLFITDPDAGEDRFREPEAAALQGTFGSFAFDPETGAWSYTLDNDAEAVQALPEGEQVTDSLTVTSLDGTASETITVTVTGVNDPASITGDTTGAVTEDDPDRQQASGVLTVTDPDAGEDRFREPEAAALQGTFGSFAFDPETGAWSYTLDNDAEAVQSLPEGAEVTDSLTVTSLDGTASETITVTVTGAGVPEVEPGTLLTAVDVVSWSNGVPDAQPGFRLDVLSGEGPEYDFGLFLEPRVEGARLDIFAGFLDFTDEAGNPVQIQQGSLTTHAAFDAWEFEDALAPSGLIFGAATSAQGVQDFQQPLLQVSARVEPGTTEVSVQSRTIT